MSFDARTDALLRRAAAINAAHVHQRVVDSHELRDPDIETGSIDAAGNLTPSQSSASIPPSMYHVSARVLQEHPDFGDGDIVLFVWADEGASRRPYVIDVLDVVTPFAETATLNSDGTITTQHGVIVQATDWSRTLSTTNTLTGHRVVIVWADTSVFRKAYAVAEL